MGMNVIVNCSYLINLTIAADFFHMSYGLSTESKIWEDTVLINLLVPALYSIKSLLCELVYSENKNYFLSSSIWISMK